MPYTYDSSDRWNNDPKEILFVSWTLDTIDSNKKSDFLKNIQLFTLSNSACYTHHLELNELLTKNIRPHSCYYQWW